MDVTQEIRKNHIAYGASDNTAPQRTASGRSLNYAQGPSITRPANENVTVIPRTLKYQSEVGLFGAENYFVKVRLNIQNNAGGICYEEPYWDCALIDFRNLPVSGPAPYYVDALIDMGDFEYTDGYEEALIKEQYLPPLDSIPYVSIDLKNIKTGNKFVDSWVDARLYTSDREEHPYDEMYVSITDYFYIGIHARNTRRLPFDIECLIGEEYRTYESIEDRRLIMNRRDTGPNY